VVSRAGATAQGLAALAIWASTVALSRSLSEQLGTLTGAAAALALGGALSLLFALARGESVGAMLRLDRRYLFGCGALFVGYMACLYAAIGLAPDRPTALAVALLNYLWPVLMVVLSVPLLGQPARLPLLALGGALALAGTFAAVLGGSPRGWASLPAGAAAPLAFAGLAGILWAVYSNLARRFGPERGDAVPLFLCASAGALALVRLAFPEHSSWSPRSAVELALLAAGPMAAAYSLWEKGVREGNHALLGLTSYFLPLASLLIAAAYWGVVPGAHLAVGCALTVAGALVSGRSLKKPL
jgi:drug/metabolite transporter (DMT)-like permease